MNNNIILEELKSLTKKIIEYTKTWSITENEWYWNIDCTRKPSNSQDENITTKEFERAIREEILYCLIYNIDSIRNQLENDYQCGYYNNQFDIDNRALEKEIQKYYKDFKVERY